MFPIHKPSSNEPVYPLVLHQSEIEKEKTRQLELIKEIKEDYDFIRNKLITQGFKSLTGKDGKWIQARTKGAGHGSTSRAFYARTCLVKKIFEIAS